MVQSIKEWMKSLPKWGLILLVLLVLLLLFWIFRLVFDGGSGGLFGGNSNGSKNGYTNSEELENGISVSQANYSLFIYGSDKNNDNNEDTLNIGVTPHLNISVNNPDIVVNSVKVVGVGVDSKPKLGKVIRSFPNHSVSRAENCTGFFFEGCDANIETTEAPDMGDSFEFTLVDNFESLLYYDEVISGSMMPQFKFTIVEAGSFDGAAILARDNVYEGAKALGYSGVNPTDLVSTLAFDLQIDTNLGMYGKHFEIILSADEFVGTGLSNLAIDVVK